MQKILLFGSYARKKPHYGSDVDLLVIVSTHRPQEFEKIYQTLFDISLDYEWTPIIISEKEYRQLRAERKEFFRNIEEEKVVIWSKNGR
jgi:predicted nucleotidyltransferase